MKNLNRILCYCLLAFSYLSQPLAALALRPFNYATDMAAVDEILKLEWQKLFGTQTYDSNLVNGMFKLGRPGDVFSRNQKLHITVLTNESNAVIGFITHYFVSSTICHLELLALHKNYQSKGYGRYMIDQLSHQLTEQKCKNLELYVFNNNPRAINFYKKLGFTIKNIQLSYCLMNKGL